MQDACVASRTESIPRSRCRIALVWIVHDGSDGDDRRSWLCLNHGGGVGEFPPKSEYMVSPRVVSHCNAADGTEAVARGDLFPIAHVHRQTFDVDRLPREEV
jgi:hypothetical protein